MALTHNTVKHDFKCDNTLYGMKVKIHISFGWAITLSHPLIQANKWTPDNFCSQDVNASSIRGAKLLNMTDI